MWLNLKLNVFSVRFSFIVFLCSICAQSGRRESGTNYCVYLNQSTFYNQSSINVLYIFDSYSFNVSEYEQYFFLCIFTKVIFARMVCNYFVKIYGTESYNV